jgi:hypothetical protein
MSEDKNNQVFGESINKSISSLQQNFEPHNFSRMICEVIKSQTNIPKAIKEVIDQSLSENVPTQEIIKNIINKHTTYMIGKYILGGSIVGGILISIVTVLIKSKF